MIWRVLEVVRTWNWHLERVAAWVWVVRAERMSSMRHQRVWRMLVVWMAWRIGMVRLERTGHHRIMGVEISRIWMAIRISWVWLLLCAIVFLKVLLFSSLVCLSWGSL